MGGVTVEIGAFAAHGLSPAAARRCADSFVAELTRLLAEQPIERAEALGPVPPLSLPATATTTSPAGIGAAAARQLHRAWTR